MDSDLEQAIQNYRNCLVLYRIAKKELDAARSVSAEKANLELEASDALNTARNKALKAMGI